MSTSAKGKRGTSYVRQAVSHPVTTTEIMDNTTWIKLKCQRFLFFYYCPDRGIITKPAVDFDSRDREIAVSENL
jgi:hypothetical protein